MRTQVSVRYATGCVPQCLSTSITGRPRVSSSSSRRLRCAEDTWKVTTKSAMGETPGVRDEEVEEICAVCKNAAKQKCSACKAVYYCSREHQKLHWKTHAKNCRAFRLAENSEVGRHYVATRRIEPGELLLLEKTPLVAAPPQGTPPVCLSCYVVLNAENSKPCDNCGWPLCLSCTAHGAECEFTLKYRKSKVSITEFGFPHPTYRAVGVVRAIAMRDTDPAGYRRLLSFEDHCAEAAKQPNAFDVPNDIASFVKRFFKFVDVEEAEIAKIAGILQINGHEVPTTETSHVAVYDMASYLEHNCRANCSKSFTNDGGIAIRAAVPISKGEHISICYTDPLWGVTNRRHHLSQTKFFDCICERCKDPTEFGTMFNAIKCCQESCTGYMLPPTFLVSGEKFPDYVCRKCNATKSWESVEMMLEKIGMELSKMKKDDISACKRFIESQENFLHDNHFYNFDVKLALAQIIGQQEGGLPLVSNELLTEKITLCKKFSEILQTLVPAENRIRGVVLFEMHAGIAEFGRRQGPDALRGLLLESKKVLAEAYDLLRHEPEILPEGKIAKQARKNLRDIDIIIQTLVQNTASPT